jgi:hypothetical protein
LRANFRARSSNFRTLRLGLRIAACGNDARGHLIARGCESGLSLAVVPPAPPGERPAPRPSAVVSLHQSAPVLIERSASLYRGHHCPYVQHGCLLGLGSCCYFTPCFSLSAHCVFHCLRYLISNFHDGLVTSGGRRSRAEGRCAGPLRSAPLVAPLTVPPAPAGGRGLHRVALRQREIDASQ